jgi:CcmD family protein
MMQNRMRAGGLLMATLLLVVLAGALSAPVAAAQQPAPAASQEQFVPVKELPQHEQLPAAPLLIAAYAFVWVALLVYLFSIWRRLGTVGREMDELSRRIAERGRRA